MADNHNVRLARKHYSWCRLYYGVHKDRQGRRQLRAIQKRLDRKEARNQRDDT